MKKILLCLICVYAVGLVYPTGDAAGDFIPPVSDTRLNFFGDCPSATYGDWTYCQPEYSWLGSYKTSASSVGAGVGPDDGISFGPLTAGSVNTLTFIINIGTYTGVENFYIWADWNNDGDWLMDELIVDLEFAVSANSTLTDTVSFGIPAYWNSNLVSGDIWFNAVVSPDNNTAGISGVWARGEQEAFQQNVQPIPEPENIFYVLIGVLFIIGVAVVVNKKRRK